MCQEIKNRKSLSDNGLEKIPIASGGVHLSHDPDNILSEIIEIDIGFLNEGELSFVSLVGYQNGSKNVDELSMTYIRNSIWLFW